MVRAFFRILSVSALVLSAASVHAQQPGPPPGLPRGTAQPPGTPPQTAAPPQTPAAPQTETQISDSIERLSENHIIRTGNVEIQRPDKTFIYADMAEIFQDEDRAILTGNVVFSQGDNRITAERAELNTKTGFGTFYNAWGISTLKPPKPTVRPGAVAPPLAAGAQDNAVYFFGEKVEKVSAKKYKITKGGFSTCVQPTPRWDLHADTVILNVDHYTILRNAILEVKGVPMFYLPVLYYPTKKDQRATGFLIPTIGSTSLRGESISNAFFWAINRSEDATFTHDYFSKTGEGVGSEYRYNYGPGANGNLRGYFLDEHAADYVQPDGSTTTTGAAHSFQIDGGANQLLPGNLRARANVSYFSSIVASETFNTNIYDASRNQRSFGGNVVGAWGSYTMNATLNHTEYFYDASNSALSGSWPQISFSRNERPLFDTPAYFSVSAEYANLLRDSRSTDPNTGILTDLNSNLTRLDFFPQIRYPFKKWQWFTVNSTISWRDTYYSRSQTPLDPTGAVPQTVVDTPINRTMYTVQAQITGPVFNKVWDTPDNKYAEKFKHTVEPFLNIQRTSAIDDVTQIIQFDGTDSFVGGTQLTYGVNNRFYAKRSQAPGQPATAREILDISLTQTYYTNQTAALYDRQYQTTSSASVPSNYSPIQLSIRGMPTNELNLTASAEFDSHYYKLRTISLQGSYSWTNRVQASVMWSKKAYIPQLPDFDDCRNELIPPCVPALLDHYINPSLNMHTQDNRIGTVYSFNYDVLHSTMVQQQISVFYNAQCCGIAMQYQTYNFAGSSFPIPADHRFFLSFTLAGLGNFSPFNGAMGGTPH